ncbi:MAG: Jag N-terminal domain-containing protein [Candidatus Omnitrophota bacterium]
MSPTGKSFEFEGKTVEDAILKAMVSLNVPRETLKIKIVCEEQRGLFGMEGVKQAKIKVLLKA